MPRAATLSVVLHVGVLAAMIFWLWWSQRNEEKPETRFELVAGPGENYAAQEAPTVAAETPTVNLTLPKPEPRPAPPQPVQERTPPPQPAPKETPREATPPRIERVPEKPNPIKKVEPEREKVSWSDFTKEHGAPKTQPAPKTNTPIQTKKIDTSTVLSSTTTVVSAGAGGTAMTSREIDLSKRYIAFIIQQIRQAMEAAGVTEPRDAGVQFAVSKDGVLSDVRITQSSGSGEFDRAVLAAFRSIGRIGPPPTNRAEVFRTVIRLSER